MPFPKAAINKFNQIDQLFPRTDASGFCGVKPQKKVSKWRAVATGAQDQQDKQERKQVL